ncbi:MAG: hypothetical protein HKM05_03435 [Spirochaetales bacterium]|nr:hypothetical protein [Spirochaetales bacterium]
MLQEYLGIRQEAGAYRRFFSDEAFHLYVWYAQQGGELTGFQLVILRGGEPTHALTWEKAKGAVYTGVWAEDEELRISPTPILVPDGPMPQTHLFKLFSEASVGLEESLRQLVLHEIQAYA